MTTFDPELDLTLTRIIKAPRATVWQAYADPRRLEQWWVPKPAEFRVISNDLTPGGVQRSEWRQSPDEDWSPFGNGITLAVVEGESVTFTDFLTEGYRPAPEGFMVATLEFREHPEGTEYVATARHATAEKKQQHEEMGFHEGWGLVAEQLAAHVEG